VFVPKIHGVGLTCCSVLQCVAVCCRVLRCQAEALRRRTPTCLGANRHAMPSVRTLDIATHCNTLQHTTAHCNTLQQACYAMCMYPRHFLRSFSTTSLLLIYHQHLLRSLATHLLRFPSATSSLRPFSTPPLKSLRHFSNHSH